MRRRRWISIGVFLGGLAFAGIDAPTTVEASLVKSDGSPPIFMPNTLLVEAGERLAAAPPPSRQSPIARTVADAKQSPRSCSAAAVRIPHQGTRLVTARHCADQRSLEVMDEQHHVTPIGQVDAAGEVDLSVLDVREPLPWSGLELRSAASVAVGERLCAWRLHHGPEGIARERICGRLLRREARGAGDPLLVLSHPYPAGTSGSALVDREGRVVGIVVASTGLSGLAEPIDGVLKLRFPAVPTGTPRAVCDDGKGRCVSP